jgi:hypothetical protein
MKVVWSDLEHFCKFYERNKKTEKKKKEEEKNMKLDPGNHSSPRPERAHGPAMPHPEPVPSVLSPWLPCGPHMSSLSPSRWSRRSNARAVNSFGVKSCFIPLPFWCYPVPIRRSPPPLDFPSASPCNSTARPVKSLAGVRHSRRQERRISTRPDHPMPSLLPYPSKFPSAHLLTLMSHTFVQKIDASMPGRSTPTSEAPPAVLYSFIWKRSRQRFTLSSLPHRSDPRHSMAAIQDPSETHRSSTYGHTSPATTGNPSPMVSSPSRPLWSVRFRSCG